MTLSAPASSDCVTGRPIVFPVFNLIGSSKTVRLAYHRFIGMFQVRDPTRLLYDRNRLIFLAAHLPAKVSNGCSALAARTGLHLAVEPGATSAAWAS